MLLAWPDIQIGQVSEWGNIVVIGTTTGVWSSDCAAPAGAAVGKSFRRGSAARDRVEAGVGAFGRASEPAVSSAWVSAAVGLSSRSEIRIGATRRRPPEGDPASALLPKPGRRESP